VGGSALSVRVVLVRHGESTFNISQRIQGRTDHSRLTEKGQAQADCTRHALAELALDLAYCSPLSRAHETAQRILVAHPDQQLRVTDSLREIDLEDWAGKTFAEVEEQFPEAYRCWRADPLQLKLGDRYPVRELWEQARQFWGELAQAHPELTGHTTGDPTLTVLLVGHSAINRALISSALGIGPEHFQKLGQSNCAISVLNFGAGIPLSWQPGMAQLESVNQTAHLGEPLPPKKDGIRLLLVRHGETDWNRDQRFQGQRDIPLNSTGEAQAQKVADFLANYSIDIAFSSPLKRPWDTAEAIRQRHPGLELISIDLLQEICHGSWEGKLQSEIEAEFPGQLEQWQCQPETVQMPRGENLAQVWERTGSAWQTILDKITARGSDITALVVAHDAINKAAIARLFDLGPAAFWCFKQGNGAVTVIDYPQGSQGSALLRACNITAHLSGGILDCTAAGAL
jgi:broad specificity phosphatase PhoE